MDETSDFSRVISAPNLPQKRPHGNNSWEIHGSHPGTAGTFAGRQERLSVRALRRIG